MITPAHRGASRLLATLITSVVGFALMLLTAPPSFAADYQFTEGHLDIFTVTSENGALSLSIKEDITGSGIFRNPEDVELIVGDNTYSTATENVAGINEPTYFLPQVQEPGKLWPGWDTLAVSAGGFESVDFNIADITGPGTAYVFESSGFGDINPVSTNGSFEITNTTVITQPYPAHRHVNWAFSKPGVYTMQVYASAGAVESNTATYTWVVGSGTTPTDDTTDQPRRDDRTDADAARPATPGIPAAPRQQPTNGATPKPAARPAAQPATNSDNKQPAANAPVAPAAPAAPATPQCTNPKFTPLIKDDNTVPATWRGFPELTFTLGDKAEKRIPTDLGPVPAGTAWMIGSTQEPGVPWLGANTQHPSMLENVDGGVLWELTGFSGPGAMMVYSQGNLGNIIGEEWFHGEDNAGYGAKEIAYNTHVHPNWVFSEPGTYQVTIRQTATLTNGSNVSATGTLTFEVGLGGEQSGHFDIGGAIDINGQDCDQGTTDNAGSGVTQTAAGGGGAARAAGTNAAAAHSQTKANSAARKSTSAKKTAAKKTAAKKPSLNKAAAHNTDHSSVAQATADDSSSLVAHIVRSLPFVILGFGLFVFGAGLMHFLNTLNALNARNTVKARNNSTTPETTHAD